MIMSVSTLTIGMGAATPVIFVNFSMVRVPVITGACHTGNGLRGKGF
jgi:hypothetical protein